MKHQQGVGLIEILVAILILAISLLTIASLQSKSLQYNQSAYWRSQANVLAYDVFDRLRTLTEAEKAVAAGGDHAQITAWKARLAQVLPSGDGTIACDNVAGGVAVRICTATVNWSEASITTNANDAAMTFTYSTSL